MPIPIGAERVTRRHGACSCCGKPQKMPGHYWPALVSAVPNCREDDPSVRGFESTLRCSVTDAPMGGEPYTGLCDECRDHLRAGQSCTEATILVMVQRCGRPSRNGHPGPYGCQKVKPASEFSDHARICKPCAAKVKHDKDVALEALRVLALDGSDEWFLRQIGPDLAAAVREIFREDIL